MKEKQYPINEFCDEMQSIEKEVMWCFRSIRNPVLTLALGEHKWFTFPEGIKEETLKQAILFLERLAWLTGRSKQWAKTQNEKLALLVN